MLSETGLIDLVINPGEPPKKMGHFVLSDESSNTWETNLDLADCANKHVRTILSNQTLTEGILIANSIPFNKRDFLQDPYFR